MGDSGTGIMDWGTAVELRTVPCGTSLWQSQQSLPAAFWASSYVV